MPKKRKVCPSDHEELGWVYILVNSGIPGLIKIGSTNKDVEQRAAELSAASGVPVPFIVAYYAQCDQPREVEREIHAALSKYRVIDDREFFRIDIREAISVMEEVASRYKADHSSQNVIWGSESAEEREDRLLSECTKIAVKRGVIWPSLLRGELKITLTEAENLCAKLEGRGVVDSGLQVVGVYRDQYNKQFEPAKQEERERKFAALVEQRAKRRRAMERVRPNTNESISADASHEGGTTSLVDILVIVFWICVVIWMVVFIIDPGLGALIGLPLLIIYIAWENHLRLS